MGTPGGRARNAARAQAPPLGRTSCDVAAARSGLQLLVSVSLAQRE